MTQAEHEVPAVGHGRITGRAEDFDEIDFHVVIAGDPMGGECEPHRSSEMQQCLKILFTTVQANALAVTYEFA